MSLTPKLKLTKWTASDGFNMDALNAKLDDIDEKTAPDNFYTTAVYDSANTRIICTIRTGIAEIFDAGNASTVETTESTLYYIDTPAINTTYYIYLQGNGTFIHNSTGIRPATSILLWAVTTGETVDILILTDRRARISSSGYVLESHLSADNPHGIDIPNQLSDLSDDSTHRVVTDTEKSTWNGKVDSSNVLTKTNITEYTPSTDYHPATKKYVDDNVGESGPSNILDGNATGAVRTVGSLSDYTMGSNAFAEGNGTSTSGNSSHAEGDQCTASGTASHAEGSGSVASGAYSHAENISNAAGYASHTENYGQTLAGADGAHAEGYGIASGDASHAEGYRSEAIGYYAHAEGESTEASGNDSHSEGRGSVASGDYSHAEGYYTASFGSEGHAEGKQTVAGMIGHAEGEVTLSCYGTFYSITAYDDVNKTITLDNVTGLVVGDKLQIRLSGSESTPALTNIPITAINGLVVTLDTTETIGSNWSHAIEASTTTHATHAEGTLTVASGNSSHAEGYETYATGPQAHAEGNLTWATNYRSHAEGQGSVASGSTSHAEGSYTEAAGNYSHSGGRHTIAQGYGQTAIGKYNEAQGTPDLTNLEDLAFIVGIGTSTSDRGNGFTSDWAGNTNIPDGADYKINGQGLNAMMPRKNLLTNWFFPTPVNSRGKSSYAVNDFTIDRWRTWIADMAVAIVSGGIQLTYSGAGTSLWAQYLPIDLTGKTVTVSMKSASGNVYQVSGVASTSSSIYVNSDASDLNCSVYFAWDAGLGRYCVYFLVSSGVTTGVIESVKLELGSVSTLAYDPPMDYPSEKMFCQHLNDDGSFKNEAVNKNLIINPDFRIPINQRGQSSYSTMNAYTIDMWKIGSLAGSMTVNAGSITITSGAVNFEFTQKLTEIYALLDGLPLTLSAELDDGTIYSGTCVFDASVDAAQIIAPLGSTGFNLELRMVPSSSYCSARFRAPTSGVSVTVKRVKLEIGYVSTLAFDHPVDSGERLRECQKYLYELSFRGSICPAGIGYVESSTLVRLHVPLPVPMRITPSVVSFSNLRLRNGSTTAATYVSVDVCGPGEIMLNVTVSSGVFTAGEFVDAYLYLGNLLLSAEL